MGRIMVHKITMQIQTISNNVILKDFNIVNNMSYPSYKINNKVDLVTRGYQVAGSRVIFNRNAGKLIN